jgi:hypothetical protein
VVSWIIVTSFVVGGYKCPGGRNTSSVFKVEGYQNKQCHNTEDHNVKPKNLSVLFLTRITNYITLHSIRWTFTYNLTHMWGVCGHCGGRTHGRCRLLIYMIWSVHHGDYSDYGFWVLTLCASCK